MSEFSINWPRVAVAGLILVGAQAIYANDAAHKPSTPPPAPVQQAAAPEPEKPRPYDCELKLIDIGSMINMRKKYADEMSQIDLDVQMGRRGDYGAVKDEMKWAQRMFEKGGKQIIEDGNDYIVHGCKEKLDDVEDIIKDMRP